MWTKLYIQKEGKNNCSFDEIRTCDLRIWSPTLFHYTNWFLIIFAQKFEKRFYNIHCRNLENWRFFSKIHKLTSVTIWPKNPFKILLNHGATNRHPNSKLNMPIVKLTMPMVVHRPVFVEYTMSPRDFDHCTVYFMHKMRFCGRATKKYHLHNKISITEMMINILI